MQGRRHVPVGILRSGRQVAPWEETRSGCDEDARPGKPPEQRVLGNGSFDASISGSRSSEEVKWNQGFHGDIDDRSRKVLVRG